MNSLESQADTNDRRENAVDYCQMNGLNAYETAVVCDVSTYAAKKHKTSGLRKLLQAQETIKKIINTEYPGFSTPPDTEKEETYLPILRAVAARLGVDFPSFEKSIKEANDAMLNQVNAAFTSHQGEQKVLSKIMEYTSDSDAANSLIFAIQQGQIPGIEWVVYEKPTVREDEV